LAASVGAVVVLVAALAVWRYLPSDRRVPAVAGEADELADREVAAATH